MGFHLEGTCKTMMLGGKRKLAGLNLCALILFILAFTGTVSAPAVAHSDGEVATNLAVGLIKPTFRHINTDDGLPNNNIWSIARDKYGYMWFGTRFGGLARYDGYDIRVFQHDENDPSSLSHNYVWAILSDSKGRLWVGTNGGGLNRYDEKTEKFIRYVYGQNDPSLIPHPNIKSIYEDGEGTIWVGSNGGLSKYIEETDNFKTITEELKNQGGLSGNSVRAITEKPHSDNLWLGTRRSGLVIYNKKSGELTRYRHNPNDPTSLSNDAVNNIFFSSTGHAWISTRDGLNRFNPLTNSFIRYSLDTKNEKNLSGNWVNQVDEDLHGNIWVATLSGLDFLDNTIGEFKHIKPIFGNSGSISDTAINVMYSDNVGALWVGTENGGISRLDAQKNNFNLLEPNPHADKTVSGKAVQAVFVDSVNRLWLGTNHGLDVYDSQKFTFMDNNSNNPRSISHQNIKSINEDAAGNIWVGTIKGLNRLNGNGFDRFVTSKNRSDAIAGKNIIALGVDNNKNIWAGINGIGVSVFNGSSFDHYYGIDKATNKPEPFYPKAIITDKTTDGVWIGTNNMGLAHVAKGGAIKYYPLFPEHPKSELHNFVRTIKEGPNKMLWLGTNLGIMEFDPKLKTVVKNISTNDGLLSDTIMSMEFDRQGNLWAATGAGINKIKTINSAISSYPSASHIYGAQFLPNASTIDIHGNIYLGTDRGLLFFAPEQLYKNITPPPVVITSIKIISGIGNKFNDEKKTISQIKNTDEIIISPEQNIFTISFSALDYSFPERNLYAFKLEGHDVLWRNASAKSRFASYSSVPPGEYTFLVQASNSDGVWNNHSANIKITILPKWWQTNLFTFAVGLSIATLIVLAFYWQRTAAKKHKDELTALVNERTMDLYRAKMEAEHANSVKTVFLANMSHELRTPLNAVIGFTDVIKHGLFGKLNNEKYDEYIENIQQSGHHLLDLINEILDLASIETGKITFSKKDVYVADVTESSLVLIRPRAEKQKIYIKTKIADDIPMLHLDKLRLKQVLLNIISNSVKYTNPGGEVTISIKESPSGFVNITISDTGIGMNPDELALAKAPFERVGSRKENVEGTGLGLPLAINIVEKMGGTIDVESSPDIGTSVSITFPV